jgi:mono/diheme cytochrome c family protein
MRLFAALAISLTFTGCRGADGDLPASYRGRETPEASLRSAASRQRGRRLFVAYCALCHGEAANGRGARAEGLARSPADFTNHAWRRRTSPRRAFFLIREGVRGTPMPSWKSLSDDEVWDLVAYVLSVANIPPNPNEPPE